MNTNVKRGIKGFVSRPLKERFMEKITIKENGCWEWIGATDNNYGQIWIDGKKEKAHRASYKLHYGEIPHNVLVCHKCDNKICVNPEHLFIGTQSDNMKDCSNKNRTAFKKYPYILRRKKTKTTKGEQHHQAKLKEYQVIEIRNLFNSGIRLRDISAKYGINRKHIQDIVHFRSWKHVAAIGGEGLE
jgi:hypothetical protein